MSDVTKRKALPLAESGALIVGGTSGVGLAAAIRLAEAGVPRIVLNGRNVERGAAARQAVLAQVPAAQVEFVPGDCNEIAGASFVCGEARARIGAIDLLVNSTLGAYTPQLLHSIAPETVGDILIKQAMAPLLTSRLVWTDMQAQGGGCIINIASDAGKSPTPGESVIGAAMAAIIMYSKTLAIEGKRNGIRVNCLTPSIIEGTAGYDKVMADEFSSKLFGKAIKLAQLGVVTADDMAGLIVFLASPAAAKLTGQAISMNGGISAA